MYNPNGLLSQRVCHYLNQGRTLNDMLMRAAHSMAYFDLSKLNLALLMYRHSVRFLTIMVTDVIKCH